MTTNRRRSGRWLIAILTFSMALSLWVQAAAAAPTEPIMGLSDLQAKLDAEPDGVVDGYLKTVLRGSTIETLPCEILAITSDDAAASNSQKGLILFRATGPKIEAFGGIVAGMSGSPIYVDDAGTDKVVGALSYGDSFTLSGVGLATPIEAMTALEGYTATSIQTVSTPVATEDGVVTQVVITADKKVAAGFRQSEGTFVARPLAALSIGGLPPSSPGYKRLAGQLEAKGLSVLPLTGPLGLEKDSFSVDLEPGSAVAAMISRGDFWVGGIGTVTYADTDNDTVVAFGHPMEWDGVSGYGLSNAWIDGVWPSSYSPYKLGRPGALRGTVTQDRGAGIVGEVGMMPAEATITATIHETQTGNTESAVTRMPRALLNGQNWGMLVPSAVYATALRACDDYWYVGSAVTTTTVVVRDSITDEQFTIVRRNVWDSDWDVPSYVPGDADSIVAELEWVGSNGIAHPDILSVDVVAEISDSRDLTEIADVAAPQGLRVGANPLVVSLLDHGSTTTRTVDVTMTIPAGTPLQGFISVSNGAPSGDGEEGPSFTSDRRTTAQTVADINAVPGNDQLVITFVPMDYYGPVEPKPVEVTATAGAFVSGYAEKYTSTTRALAVPSVINYNGSAIVSGEVSGVTKDATVKFYARTIGTTTERLIGSTTADYDPTDGVAYFDYVAAGFKKNTVITAVFAGDETVLGSRGATSFKVRAAVGLAASTTTVRLGSPLTLTASVTPTDSVGTIVFDVYRNAKWQQLATRPLTQAKSTLTYKPPVGTWSIRARYLGSAVNAGQVSKTVVVKVR